MNKVSFKINGIALKNYPLEFKEFKIIADFAGKPTVDGQQQNIEVGIDRITLTGDHDLNLVRDHINTYGYLIGVPFQIIITDENGVLQGLPEMYLDLKDNPIWFDCYKLECSVAFVRQRDWFTERASTFSFNYLDKEVPGLFVTSDFTPVRYHLNFRDKRTAFALLSIMTFQMQQVISQASKEIADSIAEVIDAVTPAVGFGVVTVVGAIILASLKAVARIVYNIAIIIYMVRAMQDLIEQIFPPTHYHTGVWDYRLMEIGCAHLGLEFESSIFTSGSIWRRMVSIPSKTREGSRNPSLILDPVFTQRDAEVYNFGAYFQSMLEFFNADYRISDGVLRFERWDYWQTQGSYKRPKNFNDQKERVIQEHKNLDEFTPEYLIAFKEDVTDRNTVENFVGTNCDMITEPVNDIGTEKKYNNSKGVPKEIRIPFALATKAPDELDGVEKVLKALAKIVDFFTGKDLASTITSRTEDMVLSEHTFDVPKKVLVTGRDDGSYSIRYDNRDQLNATVLWDDYHYINSFKPINGKHNQWLRFPNMKGAFCKSDFEKLILNNFDSEGEEIERVEWNIFDNWALISYRVNEEYEFNLKQTFIEAGNGENGSDV